MLAVRLRRMHRRSPAKLRKTRRAVTLSLVKSHRSLAHLSRSAARYLRHSASCRPWSRFFELRPTPGCAESLRRRTPVRWESKLGLQMLRLLPGAKFSTDQVTTNVVKAARKGCEAGSGG